jgi:hypothetical protein
MFGFKNKNIKDKRKYAFIIWRNRRVVDKGYSRFNFYNEF